MEEEKSLGEQLEAVREQQSKSVTCWTPALETSVCLLAAA